MSTIITRQTIPVKKQFLGDILLKRGLITKDQLKDTLIVQEMQGGHLGGILVNLGYVSERDILAALVIQCHIPYIAVDQYEIDRKVIDLIPEEMARNHHVVPLDCVNDILSVVMVNPIDVNVKNELKRITQRRIVPFIATLAEIDNAIQRGYNRCVSQ
jgi:type IV pilus assembly protein PilB